MRIRISHLTSYRYATPATSVIQRLRLTPRNHDGQYVARLTKHCGFVTEIGNIGPVGRGARRTS